MQSLTQIRLKRRFTRLAALLFVIYALADVSVLQIYCGNEALGIPPDHHMADLGRHLERSNDTPLRGDQADSQQIPDDNGYDHRHECFCWQQVVVGLYIFSPGSLIEIVTIRPPGFYEDPHTVSGITHLFRPPRTA